ncbi:tyrosine-type recombinase/integrase [Falsihalocynthiibacter arcticus]|uniref:Integrase n=1 Tax=Falsihalocynthiibacter arcticus TaxID=1579316 RepID=A0A126V1Z2_9RHOB|nr:site-specific integrase [Falsihalocynthiibacter arcticus]AML52338.1 integrase [Falsihalocynthiibacter arcticus]
MASIKKLQTGKWQAQVAMQGIRKSKSFEKRVDAKDWAARQEFLIREGEVSGSTETMRDALLRYAREVSPSKRGAKWEQLRLEKIARGSLGDVVLRDVQPIDIANWRDMRLREVAAGTVNREMTLLSGVFSIARKEWGIIKVNPMTDVRKPTKPNPRDRRISDEEIALLIENGGGDLGVQIGRAIHAFQFAIETGMRAGEIVGLVWDDVNFETRVAKLEMTKNGTGRSVPLSTAAVALLKALPVGETGGACFAVKSANLDVLFRRVRDRAGIKNLTFHDSRHEAITRMASKLDVLSLARVVGHKDIRMLQIYYNETAEQLAQRLG